MYIYIYVMILRFFFFIQTFLKYCKGLSTETCKRYINILLLLLFIIMMMMEMIMKQTVSRKVLKKEAVSDFQNLSFIKRGYVQTLSCKNEFYFHEHKKSFSSIAWHLVSPWNRGLAQIRNGVLAIETKARAPKRKTRSEIWQRFIASSRTQSRALKLEIVLFL